MDFQLATAILASLIGTAAMTAMMYMGYLVNMRMDMPLTVSRTRSGSERSPASC